MSRGNLPFFHFAPVFKGLKAVRMLYILGGLFLMGLGGLMFLRPDIFYELTESWKTRQGNPTDRYLLETRIGGVMCFLAGLCGVVVLFLQKSAS